MMIKSALRAGMIKSPFPAERIKSPLQAGARLTKLVLVLLAALNLAPACAGQEQAIGRALGVVTNLDAGARQITLKTDTGEVAVTADGKAKLLRVAPGATNLNSAAPIELNDIGVGDRLRARGRMSADQKSIAALEIVVISQGDIAGKQAAERADWDRRGATGIVADVAAGSFTINVRTLEGVKPLVITPAPNTIIRRYTPDSVKFSDAKASTLAEIRKGDQVRARGDKTPDGATMTAEEIVSGQFKMIAGLVISVDAQANVIRINNIETKKPMNIRVSEDSSLKKLQPMLAQAIANRLHGVATGAGGPGGAANRSGGPGGAPGAPGPAAAARTGAGGPVAAGPVAAGPGGAGPGGAGPGAAGLDGTGPVAAGPVTAAPGGAGPGGAGPGGAGPAGMQANGQGGAGPRGAPGGLAGGRGPGGFGGGRGAGGDLQSMIDRTPAIKISDLMAGDAIIVSSVAAGSADQVTAITLLAGVEPILTKPGTREMSLGDWNMGGGGDVGGIGQ